MRSTPSVRRRRHRGPAHTFLPSLARLVDEATVDDPDHVMVRVEGPIDDEVDLGLRPMDPGSHPFEVLAGFEAPEAWTVFGVRAVGRARHLDQPHRAPRRVATTYLVDRHGRDASLLRIEDEVEEPPGPATGTVPDLCRRVLGLPTPPPPRTTAVLWTAVWLHRILERWAQPTARRELLTSWAQVAALHPAVGAPAPPDLLVLDDPAALASLARAHAATTTWEQLRHARDPLPLPDGPLPPDIAAWMDDGFFARWTIGAHPPIASTATELAGLLGHEQGQRLKQAVLVLLSSD